EVDREEPEAVDDRRRTRAGLGDAFLPRLLVFHRRRPRDVMNRSGAGNPLIRRRVLVLDPAAARLAARLEPAPRTLEPELREERCGVRLCFAPVRANAFEPLQRELTRDLRMVGDQRLVRDVRDHELVTKAFGIVERKRASVALHPEPFSPEVELIR